MMRKYELATSIHWRYDSTGQEPITCCIERIHHAGFTNLDFPYLNMCLNRQSDFLQDNYLNWLKATRAFTDELGCRFVQAHAPCESIYETHMDINPLPLDVTDDAMKLMYHLGQEMLAMSKR